MRKDNRKDLHIHKERKNFSLLAFFCPENGLQHSRMGRQVPKERL
ncbi:hypothetical protein [Candidatus Methylacidiphilum infernorum]|uniref:Uncharacterized protein n=1 Tax=Methylacidiphilum infernorum (isolate V4) TaxID=481448 RepID=B3E027_METI4|nr:hypothetical protein [Candidatus Methylacidiphilum infernorum]ACD82688.1 Hypothetical protein Minf_0633 [Methylacidiphilum infernorum V4]